MTTKTSQTECLHKSCINKISGKLKSFFFLYKPTFQNREKFVLKSAYLCKQLAETVKILSRKRKKQVTKVALLHDQSATFAW